jgi:hypothetical protein
MHNRFMVGVVEHEHTGPPPPNPAMIHPSTAGQETFTSSWVVSLPRQWQDLSHNQNQMKGDGSHMSGPIAHLVEDSA